ncbi:thymidylate kinase-like [Lineus longissimus]|uniref:thymidylate kinase-like n=1 Tax=Lineus longissimus TaxID=88925 RepID=UPI002B4F5FB7
MLKKLCRMVGRGALIVLEGCDRCGKSTQSCKLVEVLNQRGSKASFMCFPDRSTRIGSTISDYLEKKCELEDHAVHLLFSANRWELVPKITSLLESGTTLVIDRYAYSGVAFTAAKPGFTMDWCRKPDIGLPKPDLVLYLDLKAEDLQERKNFGEERYEKAEFQQKVAENYKILREPDWQVLDAGRSIEEIHSEILKLAENVIRNVDGKEIGKLWVDPPTSPTKSPPLSPNKVKRVIPEETEIPCSPKRAKLGPKTIPVSPSKMIKCF